jgi:FAD/FMN-containing dehydrogenase
VAFGASQGCGLIYDFANANNVEAFGGTSETVGVARGGHSTLSSMSGLGIDNVQRLRVVLQNGTYITANRRQNQDVSYALRGARAFGVARELSAFAHPVQVCNSSFYGYNDTLTIGITGHRIRIRIT